MIKYHDNIERIYLTAGDIKDLQAGKDLDIVLGLNKNTVRIMWSD